MCIRDSYLGGERALLDQQKARIENHDQNTDDDREDGSDYRSNQSLHISPRQNLLTQCSPSQISFHMKQDSNLLEGTEQGLLVLRSKCYNLIHVGDG